MARQAIRQVQQPAEEEDFADDIARIPSDDDGDDGDDDDGRETGASLSAASFTTTSPSLFTVPDPPKIAVPPPGASATAFRTAMMQYQTETLKLRDLAQRLVEEVARLRGQLNRRTATQNVDRPNLSASPDPTGWTAEWNEFARQYLYLIQLWRGDHAFGLMAHPGIDPNSPTRYTDEASMRAAQAAELYDLIPPKFHPVLAHANSGFADKFKKKVQGARSNLLSMLIAHAGEIFDMPPHYFPRNSSYDRSKDPAIQRLLRDAHGEYGPFPRVIFPEGDDTIVLAHIFQSIALARVLRLMLNGPNALASHSGPSMGQPPVGKKWNIKTVTPGLVAGGGTILLYLLSGDTSFQHHKVGDKTGINYSLRFDEFKRIYICLSPERQRKVNDFFLLHVFGVVPRVPPPAATISSGPMSIEDGLLAINEPSLVIDDESLIVNDEQPATVNDEQPATVNDEQPAIISEPIGGVEPLVDADDLSELSYVESVGEPAHVSASRSASAGRQVLEIAQPPAIITQSRPSSSSSTRRLAAPRAAVLPRSSTPAPRAAAGALEQLALGVNGLALNDSAPEDVAPAINRLRPTSSASTRPAAPPAVAAPRSNTTAPRATTSGDSGGLALNDPAPEDGANAGKRRGRSATKSQAQPGPVITVALTPADNPEAPVIAAHRGGRRKRKQ